MFRKKMFFFFSIFSTASLFSCGLANYNFGSNQPGVAFQDSRSNDNSTGVFNSRAGRLESTDTCVENEDCVELCDSMLKRFSDQKKCYDQKEKEVQTLRDVYNLLAIGNPRKLIEIDSDDMEEFLVFGPELWRDAIYGFERQRKEDCDENDGSGDARDREDCRLSNYYKQEGYYSDGAAATLKWVAQNDWLAKLMVEHDNEHVIMQSLLEVLSKGGNQSMGDDDDQETEARREKTCNLELYEEDKNGDGNCDLINEDLDRDGRFDCGEDLNCDGDCDDTVDGEEEDEDGKSLDGDRHTCDRDESTVILEDIDGDGNQDCGEDRNCDGDCDDPGDIQNTDNRDGVSGNCDRSEYRAAGTWISSDDIDGDGNQDCGEDLNCDGVCGSGENDNGDDRDGDGHNCDRSELRRSSGAVVEWNADTHDIDGDRQPDCGEDRNCNGDCADDDDIQNNDNRDGVAGNCDYSRGEYRAADTWISSDDIDGDGKADCGEDRDCDGVCTDEGSDWDIDGDTVCDRDNGEDLNNDNTWVDLELADLNGDGRRDCGEDLNCDGDCDDTDIGESDNGDNRDGVSGNCDRTGLEDLDNDHYFDVIVEDITGDGRCNSNSDTDHGRLNPQAVPPPSGPDLDMDEADRYRAFGANCLGDPRENYFNVAVEEGNKNSAGLGHQLVRTLCESTDDRADRDLCVEYFYCYINGGGPAGTANTISNYMRSSGISNWDNDYNDCNLQ